MIGLEAPPHQGRIAIVSHSHPSVSKGGGEIAAYTLYSGLCKLGVDALFIAACSIEDQSKLSLGSRNERAIPVQPEKYNHFYHLAMNDVARTLHELLIEENVRIVNMHHFFNIGLQFFRSKDVSSRLVITLHEFLAICNHHGQMVTRPSQILCERASSATCSACYPEFTRQQFSFRKRIFLDALMRCDAYVSPSEFLASRFADWGLPRERMHVIENGLQPSQQLEGHRRVKAQGDSWTIGFFGQINPFKGVDVLLSAAEILRQKHQANGIHFRVHGNLIGQGKDFTGRFNDAVSKGANVSWAGPYDNSNVGRLMADCDYLLIPSRWWENSPVVIQEAFAAGLPVICSGIGGMAEKVKDGISGLHFRVNDPVDLARVILAGANAALHEKLRAHLPSPLDAEEMARRYLSIYATLPKPPSTASVSE